MSRREDDNNPFRTHQSSDDRTDADNPEIDSDEITTPITNRLGALAIDQDPFAIPISASLSTTRPNPPASNTRARSGLLTIDPDPFANDPFAIPISASPSTTRPNPPASNTRTRSSLLTIDPDPFANDPFANPISNSAEDRRSSPSVSYSGSSSGIQEINQQDPFANDPFWSSASRGENPSASNSEATSAINSDPFAIPTSSIRTNDNPTTRLGQNSKPITTPKDGTSVARPVQTAPERLMPNWNRPNPMRAQTPPVFDKKGKKPIDQRLLPTYRSGFPSLDRQSEFVRSRPSLEQNVYGDQQGFTPVNPTYRTGLPTALKEKRERETATPTRTLFISARDEDLEDPVRKPEDLKFRTLAVAPFHQRQNEMHKKGKKVSDFYQRHLFNYQRAHSAPRQRDPHLRSTVGGVDYVYEMDRVLGRANAIIDRLVNTPEPEITLQQAREALTAVRALLEEFRQLYNRSLYGHNIVHIIRLCGFLNLLRLDTRPEKLTTLSVHHIKGALQCIQQCILKELIKDFSAEAIKKHIGKRGKNLIYEVKRHADRLKVDNHDTSWQFVNFTSEGTNHEEYERLYNERGRIPYRLGVRDNIPSIEYLAQRRMTPSEWVAGGHDMGSSPSPRPQLMPSAPRPSLVREEAERERRRAELEGDDEEGGAVGGADLPTYQD